MLGKAKQLFNDTRAQSFGVKAIGSALFAVVLIAIILNQFLTLGIVENSNGPVSTDTFITIGVAGMTIAILGLLVFAGSIAMRYLDQF